MKKEREKDFPPNIRRAMKIIVNLILENADRQVEKTANTSLINSTPKTYGEK